MVKEILLPDLRFCLHVPINELRLYAYCAAQNSQLSWYVWQPSYPCYLIIIEVNYYNLLCFMVKEIQLPDLRFCLHVTINELRLYAYCPAQTSQLCEGGASAGAKAVDRKRKDRPGSESRRAEMRRAEKRVVRKRVVRKNASCGKTRRAEKRGGRGPVAGHFLKWLTKNSH